jgi:hypothetical protein
LSVRNAVTQPLEERLLDVLLPQGVHFLVGVALQ